MVGNRFLTLWLILDVLKDLIILSATTYVVFWLNYSGWWYLLALLLMSNSTLYEILAKQFGVEYGVAGGIK